MRQRALIGAALCLALTATVGFVACRSAHPDRPQQTRGPTPSPRASVLAPSRGTNDSALPADPSTQPAPIDRLAEAVAAARNCDAPSSRIINQTDGGLVFINAWRRQDAGNIDRLQGVVSAIQGQSDTFRCCFDSWTSAHPNKQGKMMLNLELGAEGAVKSASIDDTRSDIDNAVARACVVAVAKDASYPASPSNSATLVEYPFVVSAP